MTPKDKANELANKFVFKSVFDMTIEELIESRINAKQCALIAVDEILIEYKVLMIETAFCYDQFKYWNEVKQEIEAL